MSIGLVLAYTLAGLKQLVRHDYKVTGWITQGEILAKVWELAEYITNTAGLI